MAFQVNQREPVFDNNIKLIIDRRSRELFGLLLIGVSLFLFILLLSYNAEDSSWLSSSGKGPKNIMGQFGASTASLLFMIVGLSSWIIPSLLTVWGIRFLLHIGSNRALGRLVFSPIAIALICIFASSSPTPIEWSNPFGLGGLFGDMVLGSIINVFSIKSVVGLNLLTLTLFILSASTTFFVFGFSFFELKKTGGIFFTFLSFIFKASSKLLSFTVGFIALSITRTKIFNPSTKEVAGIDENIERTHRGASFEKTYADIIPKTPKASSRLKSTLSHIFLRTPAGSRLSKIEPKMSNMRSKVKGDRLSSKISSIIESRKEVQEKPNREEMKERLVAGIDDESGEMISNKSDDTLIYNQINEPFDPLRERLYKSSEGELSKVAMTKAVIKYPLQKKVVPSKKAEEDSQPALKFEDTGATYELPPLNVLTNPIIIERQQMSDEALEENARMLEAVLDDYGVKGEIVSVRPGPVVTMYELEPAPGLKASRVIGLSDDIARSMSALSARVSTVPGRSVIGIELPNVTREMVVLREILSSRDFGDGKQKLPLALGKDISGSPIVANLAKMPHLLIAGTTGSGKSVAINTMILSLLYKLSPEECRMIMIDPKMLELSVYDGIPHLLSPVVTDPKKAVVALKWVVGEMEQRYRKMSKMGVRNIDGFNGRVKETLTKGELFSRTVQTGFSDETGDPVFETEEFKPEKMPYIVVIVDEMADLMMVAGKEIEACIQRLAQMARASGIHLIMATQRPSVDVITGTIKANFPTRISFQVTSKIDSRTILGEMGAEQLLGMGDMLYMAGGSKITRIHGPFVSDEEVEEVVNHLKSFGPPEYMSGVLESVDEEKTNEIDLVLGLGSGNDGDNTLYDMAVQIVINDRKCSTSYIQRKLAIGYNKAAKIVEEMEEAGLVSSANHVGKREILVPER
jgi:S-DNA-T family DNA segregation ATPase FtsK/SpoIIIE|tara:strand:+ start:1220 stop:3976 length:2757 start_codon:yes stop_codon:yes gene_type:complete